MPAVPAGYSSGGQMNKPSCFDRIKLGFGMGFTVGMVMGVVFGGFAGLRCVFHHAIIFPSNWSFIFFYRQGARGRELLSIVGRSVMQAGGSFGTFMAIGSAIRC